MRIIPFVLLALVNIPCCAQSFIIDDAESYADLSIRKDEDHLTCFYKTWNSDKVSSHYRTISLDRNFNIIDTIGYRLEGICSFRGSDENSKYSYHIFYNIKPGHEVITFLITDKSGKTISSYDKSVEDFKPFLRRKIKRLSELRFENIKTDGEDAGLLVLRLSRQNSGGALLDQGNWIALNLLDGSLRWEMKTPVEFFKAKAVAGKLVTLQQANSGRLSLHYYNLRTGLAFATVPIHNTDGVRTVTVFEVDSSEVVLAGGDFGKNSRSNKHPRFFHTSFDLSGHLISDKVDTTERLGDSRLQLLGGAFNSAGDLILVGESYKNDAASFVGRTAAAVAIGILTYGAVVPVPSSQKIIVQSIVAVRISPRGDVKEFNSFPVERRSVFSELIKDEHQIFLRYKDQLWLYDLANLSHPPRLLKTVLQNEEVVIFLGNVIGIRKDDKKQEVTLERIDGL